MSWTTVVRGKNGFRFDRLMSSSWWVRAMSNWIGCIKQNPLMIWHMCSPLDDLEILEQQIPYDKEMMLVAECWKADFAILQQYRCLMSKVTAEWSMMIREDGEQHWSWAAFPLMTWHMCRPLDYLKILDGTASDDGAKIETIAAVLSSSGWMMSSVTDELM